MRCLVPQAAPTVQPAQQAQASAPAPGGGGPRRAAPAGPRPRAPRPPRCRWGRGGQARSILWGPGARAHAAAAAAAAAAVAAPAAASGGCGGCGGGSGSPSSWRGVHPRPPPPGSQLLAPAHERGVGAQRRQAAVQPPLLALHALPARLQLRRQRAACRSEATAVESRHSLPRCTPHSSCSRQQRLQPATTASLSTCSTGHVPAHPGVRHHVVQAGPQVGVGVKHGAQQAHALAGAARVAGRRGWRRTVARGGQAGACGGRARRVCTSERQWGHRQPSKHCWQLTGALRRAARAPSLPSCRRRPGACGREHVAGSNSRAALVSCRLRPPSWAATSRCSAGRAGAIQPVPSRGSSSPYSFKHAHSICSSASSVPAPGGASNGYAPVSRTSSQMPAAHTSTCPAGSCRRAGGRAGRAVQSVSGPAHAQRRSCLPASRRLAAATGGPQAQPPACSRTCVVRCARPAVAQQLRCHVGGGAHVVAHARQPPAAPALGKLRGVRREAADAF